MAWPSNKKLLALWNQHYKPLFPYAEVEGESAPLIRVAQLCLGFRTVGQTHLQLLEAVFHETAHAMVYAVSYGTPWTETSQTNLGGDLLGEQATQWVVHRALRAAGMRDPQPRNNYVNAKYLTVWDLKECPRPTVMFDPNHPLLLKLHEDMLAVLAEYRRQHPLRARRAHA
jgi:hypothetical protein